ncbi:hypothetical protein [Okeania sp. KiyG1]|uniref:hypothetical protein n=1 Tax=Okeania sp. KiyG1 TaxID=2720165 RepID=UPI0019217B97|nr:hypothetical protein [Okeania sp. KiyG1]GFZ90758.1 hypothetical protein CYANOKiyG1_01090 [Okeania sp. KiyG1]
MTTVKEIQAAIQFLSPDDFTYLRKWMMELDWEQWNQEIEADSDSGKLDFLVNEALIEKAENKLHETIKKNYFRPRSNGW